MHVGFSLLTLFPGRVGGSETNVRGLLEQFAAGNGPERVTVLANRHVAEAYRVFERGPVTLHEVQQLPRRRRRPHAHGRDGRRRPRARGSPPATCRATSTCSTTP